MSERVSGWRGEGQGRAAQTTHSGVAALDHEVCDDAVEYGTCIRSLESASSSKEEDEEVAGRGGGAKRRTRVVAALAQLAEVPARFRRVLVVQLERNVAHRGLEDAVGCHG